MEHQRWIWATEAWMWSGTRAADLEQRRSSGAADLEQILRPHGAHVVVFAGVAASSPAQRWSTGACHRVELWVNCYNLEAT